MNSSHENLHSEVNERFILKVFRFLRPKKNLDLATYGVRFNRKNSRRKPET